MAITDTQCAAALQAYRDAKRKAVTSCQSVFAATIGVGVFAAQADWSFNKLVEVGFSEREAEQITNRALLKAISARRKSGPGKPKKTRRTKGRK